MGNCFSKDLCSDYVEDLTFSHSKKRGPICYNGLKAELLAVSMGLKVVKKSYDIITPAEDRFPPQACELEIKKLSDHVLNNGSGRFYIKKRWE